MSDRDTPMPVIKEELGGGYYYRCGYIRCGKIIRSDYNFCPWCGQAILFDEDGIISIGKERYDRLRNIR